jgi:F0F1-type ATP synthase epsilon subunit
MHSNPGAVLNLGVFEVDDDEVEISIDLAAFFSEIDRLEKGEANLRHKNLLQNALKAGRDPNRIPTRHMIARMQAVHRTPHFHLVGHILHKIAEKYQNEKQTT